MYASQFERYELKYLLNEQQAGVIRRALLPWCAVDPHNADGESGGYPIFSLYLDTPDMRFHEAKLRDDPERFKLRVRSYAGGKVANLGIGWWGCIRDMDGGYGGAPFRGLGRCVT